MNSLSNKKPLIVSLLAIVIIAVAGALLYFTGGYKNVDLSFLGIEKKYEYYNPCHLAEYDYDTFQINFKNHFGENFFNKEVSVVGPNGTFVKNRIVSLIGYKLFEDTNKGLDPRIVMTFLAIKHDIYSETERNEYKDYPFGLNLKDINFDSRIQSEIVIMRNKFIDFYKMNKNTANEEFVSWYLGALKLDKKFYLEKFSLINDIDPLRCGKL